MKQYKLILKYKGKSVVFKEGVIMDEDQGTHSYVALLEYGFPLYNIYINGEYFTKAPSKPAAEKRVRAYLKDPINWRSLLI